MADYYDRSEKFLYLRRPRWVRFLVFLWVVASFIYITDGWVKVKYFFVDPEYVISVRWPEGGPYLFEGHGFFQIVNESPVSLPALDILLNYDSDSLPEWVFPSTYSWTTNSILAGDVSSQLQFDVFPRREGLDTLIFVVAPVSRTSRLSTREHLKTFLVKKR